MLQTMIIGNIGADAQFKSDNGHEFTTFRVAHTESWNDAAGNKQSRTMWVDVIMNGKPNVLPYLKKGTTVYVFGTTSTRVYSSEKDHCMKAGITINASRVELLSGNTDAVPGRLYDKNGQQHDVVKFYHTDVTSQMLFNTRGGSFNVDQNGWVFPAITQSDNTQSTQTVQSEDNIDPSKDDAPPFDAEPKQS